MTAYTYKAIDADGKLVEGQLEGADENELLARLKSLNLSPLAVSERKSSGKRTGSRKKKITRRDITHTTNQLSALLNAKLPLSKALQALENQAPEGALRTLVADLGAMVREGRHLSDAFAQYPQHFSSLFCSMVKAGEVGGVLEHSLASVSQMLEKDEELKSRLKGALTYPMIMMAVMTISVVVLITFVVPRFTGVFADMGAALPMPTKILIAVSELFKKWWWVMGGALALAYALVGRYVRTEKGRLAFDLLKLNLPIAGGLVREMSLARFSLTLGSLLESGVPILQAMDATRDVSGNSHISRILDGLKKEVQEGSSLSQSLARQDALFPSLVVGMVGTGEETGNLPEMLTNIGRYFSLEADLKIRRLTTLLEPVIILVMGLAVGFIIISMLLPIFEMTMMVK